MLRAPTPTPLVAAPHMTGAGHSPSQPQFNKPHCRHSIPLDHCHKDASSQRDAKLMCAAPTQPVPGSTGLTDVDRVLPVLQHLRDDENVNIGPVLPVPVLEGKGDRGTAQQVGTGAAAASLGRCGTLCAAPLKHPGWGLPRDRGCVLRAGKKAPGRPSGSLPASTGGCRRTGEGPLTQEGSTRPRGDGFQLVAAPFRLAPGKQFSCRTVRHWNSCPEKL